MRPGALLTKTLASYGITEKSGCSCANIALEMDRLGKQKCQEKFDYLFEKIKSSIKEWRRTKRVSPDTSSTFEKIIELKQPSDFIISKLLQYCIDNATH